MTDQHPLTGENCGDCGAPIYNAGGGRQFCAGCQEVKNGGK